MKIVRMKIDNFKGIVGREYDMSPTIIAVLGENGMGKTSFMDAYNRIYSGQISDVNVRTGAGSASILAELENGEFKVLELNAGSCSGLYQHDKSLIIKAFKRYFKIW